MLNISAPLLPWTCLRIVNALNFPVIQTRINYTVSCDMLKSAARTRREHQLYSICGLNGFSDLDLYLTLDVVLDFSQCFSSLVICLFKFCCKRQRRLLVSPESNLKFSHLAWITSCELIENPTESFPALCPTSAVNCYTSKEKEFPKTRKHSQEHAAGLLILLYTCETLFYPCTSKGEWGRLWACEYIFATSAYGS